ncbi:kinase-like domain-containing protein [Rhizophagus irregularis DAOM 181602=DAOM 197198]|nr:kinase-like domain-containing protein [Rhizophagus irregularis DAOM 181602=DAOM 197198]
MSTIRKELVFYMINKAFILTDYNIYDNIEKRHEFRKQTILADKSLTKEEKSVTIKKLNKSHDSDLIGRRYKKWNSEQQQLILSKTIRKVVLKKLENIENANRSWFDEAKSHLTITSEWSNVVQCYGLTQDPLDGNYILAMRKLDTNLR